MSKVLLLLMFIVGGVLGSVTAQSRKIIAHVQLDMRTEQPEQIAYRKGLKLSWSDFRGPADPNNADAVAMAYTGVAVRYEGSIKKGEVHLNIRILTHFNRSQSWVLPTSKNEHTLNHEQRHFEITALNACALFKEMSSFTFSDRFEQEIRDLQERYQKKNEEDQDRYDRETDHGIRKKAQEEWSERIQSQLNDTEICFP
jgi:hypothetical protein